LARVKAVRWLLVLIVFAALFGSAAWLLSRRSSAPAVVSGTIEQDEVHVASRYGGRVAKTLAQEGDALQAGQLIAELDAPELRAQRDYTAALLAELEHGPRTNEIAAARHEWEALTAQLVSARADADRARGLFANKTIAESEMQNVVSRADALEQNAIAAKNRYELLVEGTRPERLDQVRAQLAEIDTQLKEMRVTAPANCVLETLSVKVGDVLPPNREVATLLLPQRLWVRVYVPEIWLAKLQLGGKVTVRPDGDTREFTGTIEQINRQAEFTPRNVQTVDDRIRQVFGIKVRLPSDTILKAGMSVDAAFPDVPPPPK
jgi:HlyD family secretion protein